MAISITATERLGAYPLLAGGREKVAKSIIHYLKTGEIQYPFIRIRPPALRHAAMAHVGRYACRGVGGVGMLHGMLALVLVP